MLFFAAGAIAAVYFIAGKMRGEQIPPLYSKGGITEHEAKDQIFTLTPQDVILRDNSTITVQIADGFGIAVAAEGLGKARFLAKSPDGRIFVPDMKNMSDNTDGKIYVLSDFDEREMRFKKKAVYLSNLRNPNSVAFYTDRNGSHWLYVALTDKLVRYAYAEGEAKPSSTPEVIARFPDYGKNYTEGGWHLTRTIAIHNDTIYVSVGSSCNSCEEEPGETRAMIVVMNPDGSNDRVYAKGLRNAVGIAWAGDALYATEMGSDHLGDDAPDEPMYRITENAHYGWPYCYHENGRVYEDKTTAWKGKNVACNEIPLAFAYFDAHTAPLGLAYFNESFASPILQNSFLVALHGSGEKRLGRGHSIMRVTQDGKVQEFIAGFFKNGERLSRPVAILSHDDRSFFFTDDYKGLVYYVYAR